MTSLLEALQNMLTHGPKDLNKLNENVRKDKQLGDLIKGLRRAKMKGCGKKGTLQKDFFVHHHSVFTVVTRHSKVVVGSHSRDCL